MFQTKNDNDDANDGCCQQSRINHHQSTISPCFGGWRRTKGLSRSTVLTHSRTHLFPCFLLRRKYALDDAKKRNQSKESVGWLAEDQQGWRSSSWFNTTTVPWIRSQSIPGLPFWSHLFLMRHHSWILLASNDEQQLLGKKQNESKKEQLLTIVE